VVSVTAPGGASNGYQDQVIHREQVRLPRAGAPLRRPLGEDDYVAVTWTPDAPEDAGLASKGDRRRQRLLHLLRRASEQGATPTADDLAAALEVSRATVKRDLAALRQTGRQVKTRGRSS
jgi:biotin operon repressor